MFRSFNRKRNPNRHLTDEEKAKNLQSIRIRVEHAIGGIKGYRYRQGEVAQHPGFADLVMETCCGLHNFRLNFRPWAYPIPRD